MSFSVRVQCVAGCGAFGDPELDYLCVACHGDRAELRQYQELKQYMQQRAVEGTDSGAPRVAAATDAANSSPSRRAPPSIDHHKALDEFLSRPRERNAGVVEREREFLQRELAIRSTSIAQLHKYMVASDANEQVDPKEWGRYQYGAPPPVPRHTVDRATEIAAQMRLFCSWRRRTVRRRLETERQRREIERREQVAKTKSSFFRSLARSPSQPKSAPGAAIDAAATHTRDVSTRDRTLFASIWKKPSSG